MNEYKSLIILYEYSSFVLRSDTTFYVWNTKGELLSMYNYIINSIKSNLIYNKLLFHINEQNGFLFIYTEDDYSDKCINIYNLITGKLIKKIKETDKNPSQLFYLQDIIKIKYDDRNYSIVCGNTSGFICKYSIK